MGMRKIEDILKTLRPFLGREETEKLWRTYILLDEADRRLFERLMHLRAAALLGSGLKRTPPLDPPDRETAAGEFTLGSVIHAGRRLHPFGIRRGELLQHLAIFGRSGAGKTSIAMLLAKQLLTAHIPFFVLDWKRNYRDMLQMPRFRSVIVLTAGRDVAPFAFNPLMPPPHVERFVWLRKLTEIMAHAYFLGEGCIFLLQEGLETVWRRAASRPPTLQDLLAWLKRQSTRGRRGAWLASTIRAVASLCFPITSRIFSQKPSATPLPLLDHPVVLELDALTSADKTFLIETLLLWLHHHFLTLEHREKLRHVLFIEEAHHILLRRKQEASGRETVTDIILREIRELGEGVVLLDQHPGLISRPALGNTYCTIVLNLKHRADTRMLAESLHLSSEHIDLVTRLPVGQGLVRLQGRYTEPFLVAFDHLPLQKGTVSDRDVAASVPRWIRTQLCVPVRSDDAIKNTEQNTELTEEEAAFLADVAGFQDSPVRERYRRLGWGAAKGDTIQKSLLRKGMLRVAGHGRKGTKLLALTEKAKAVLNLQPATRRHGGPLHRYWVAHLGGLLRKTGYSVSFEYPVGGGRCVDILAQRGGRTIAIQVETRNDRISEAAATLKHCSASRRFIVLVDSTHLPHQERLGDIQVVPVSHFVSECIDNHSLHPPDD